MPLKKILGTYPFSRISAYIRERRFKNSGDYWEKRYASGGTSGRGSYGMLAAYKAAYLNSFVEQHDISSVIEFGCGDGNQLTLARYPRYTGLDISKTAIQKCREMFKADAGKTFYLYGSGAPEFPLALNAELGISLDVIYHLVEDDVYQHYMHDLFDHAAKFVIIYAWDGEVKTSPHVFHRHFSAWIEQNKKEWELVQINGMDKPVEACDFFVYKRK